MRFRTLIFLAIFLLAIAFCVCISGCENMNGERTVFGKIPLESETIKAEQIVDSIPVPSGSFLLETSITSKDNSGVAVKKYSTDSQCDQVDSYLHDSLAANDWKFLGTFRKGFFSDKIISSYYANGFHIEVSCDDIKDFRGIRKFYISCSW